MQCTHCQTENRPGRRFCAECGEPLALACAACSFANEPGEKFCGGCDTPLTTVPYPPELRMPPPQTYTPSHLTDKILAARPALAGERKQVTVLFADLKDSTELIRGLGMLYTKTGLQEQARAELSTAVEMYRTLEMTFWLPQVEAALAQVA